MPSTMDRGQYPSIGSIFDLRKFLLNTNVNPLETQIFLLNFSMEVLEKLPLWEKIPYEKSYLNILNSNKDIDNLRFLVFLRVHHYLAWATGMIQSL